MTNETIIDLGGDRFVETIHEFKNQHLLPAVNQGIEKGTHPVIIIAGMMELMGEVLTTLRHAGDQEAAQIEFEQMMQSYLEDWRAHPIPKPDK